MYSGSDIDRKLTIATHIHFARGPQSPASCFFFLENNRWECRTSGITRQELAFWQRKCNTRSRRIYQKCRLPSPSWDLLNQDLHFQSISVFLKAEETLPWEVPQTADQLQPPGFLEYPYDIAVQFVEVRRVRYSQGCQENDILVSLTAGQIFQEQVIQGPVEVQM